MAKSKRDHDIVPPDPESLLQSARSFGYGIETAIADLIDNSITARASEVHITYGIHQYNSFVRIEDNGNGMSEGQLLKAMRLGSSNPLAIREESDLGRFGLGLKTASFSQCRRLTVTSKETQSLAAAVRCWDLDFVADEEEWILLRRPFDKISGQFLGQIPESGSGTIVLWEKLDRLVEGKEVQTEKEHFYRKFESVKLHLGLIFHRYLESGKIRIIVQGDEVIPLNPFFVSSGAPTSELQEEQLSIRNQVITIQPYILPHESKLTSQEREYLSITKGWTEHQGIYLYRSDRLIADGTWLDLNLRKKENQRLCRICIDIPNTLDSEWQIDVRKASAKIPDVIRKRVKRICTTSIDKAIQVYTHRGAYVRRKNVRADIVYLWLARQKHGKRFYEINKLHPVYQLISEFLDEDAYIFQNYMKLLAEAIPVSTIVNDFADSAITMKGYFENADAELNKIYQQTLNALLQSGFSESQAKEKLNKMECFQKLILP